MSEQNANSDLPPLVTRPDPPSVARVEPPATARPRPGFLEAVLWCLVFLAVQLLALAVSGVIVMAVYAFQTPDPGRFVTDQLGRLTDAAGPQKPDAPHALPIPSEIGQALAYGMLAAQVASLGLILLLFPRRIGRDWPRQLGVRTPAAVHVLLVLLVVPGFVLLPDWIQRAITWITGVEPLPAAESLNTVFQTVPAVVAFLAVAVGPGLVEELWCRGFLGRGLCARYGLGRGVVLTSLLFGFLHLAPAYALVTAVMGAYLHFVYLATRSLWVPILLHMLNNGLGILIALSPALTEAAARLSADGQGLGPVVGLSALALLVFGSHALWSARTRVTPGEWRPDYPGISAPPPESGAAQVSQPPNRIAVLLALVSFVVLVVLLVLSGRPGGA